MKLIRLFPAAVFCLMAQWITVAAPAPATNRVPGVVIDYSPAASGRFIGSPSLAALPNGDYVASHDFFGPKTTEHTQAVSVVFRSRDRGQSWQKTATLDGAFWSTLFVHRGALYLLGTTRHHGNAVIRRSLDGGTTWTTPATAATGLLRDNGEYHCAPAPVLEYQGRLWRAMEWRNPPVAWGINYRAGVMSIPVEADLLNAANWTWAEFLPSSRLWNGGDMGAWLEGNLVATPAGELVNILRVQTQSPDEKAAIVRVSPDGRQLAFDPATGFIPFPGGAKKFTIRHDQPSGLFWSLATIVHERHRATNPGGIRNTLALTCSSNLTDWTVRCLLLYHPDVAKHGFQYVDWLFEGPDLIAACRTAYDDEANGARNNHDANYLTFHRFKNFRNLTMADSVPLPALKETRLETRAFIITGTGWAAQKLANDTPAFANRNYVWQGVPEKFRGWTCTQTSGGERAQITLRAKQEATLYAATTLAEDNPALKGWQPEAGAVFSYTDGGKTPMRIYARAVKAGEEVLTPQSTWAGTLLLLPPE